MLAAHLDQNVDLASRNHAFIDRSLEWITSRFSVGKQTGIGDFGCGAGLKINYHIQNYLKYEPTEQYDLMIMCDFCALGPRQRKIMLDKFNRALNTDGAVLLDVCSLAASDPEFS